MIESLSVEETAKILVYSFLVVSIVILYAVYKLRENKYMQTVVSIFIFGSLLFAGITSPDWPTNPYQAEISNKYIETHDFILFERDFYIFEFKDGAFERGSVAEYDYYNYEIGDKYNYTWCEEW